MAQIEISDLITDFRNRISFTVKHLPGQFHFFRQGIRLLFVAFSLIRRIVFQFQF